MWVVRALGPALLLLAALAPAGAAEPTVHAAPRIVVRAPSPRPIATTNHLAPVVAPPRPVPVVAVHDTRDSVPYIPPDLGFAQQGNPLTPWGPVTKLAPHGEEKRLWRFANRVNPGYAHDGKDRFLDPAMPGFPDARHYNCVLTTMAVEDSLAGQPTVALSGWGSKHASPQQTVALIAARGMDFAKFYPGSQQEATVWGSRFPNAVFEAADDYHVLEQRLRTSGDGARMVFTARWTNAAGKSGGHAINMVNLKGTVVVVDGQSGTIRTPEQYFSRSTWSHFRYYVTSEGAPGKSPFDDENVAPPAAHATR